jgi:hypothetical protein
MRVRVQFGSHRRGACVQLHAVEFHAPGGGLEEDAGPAGGFKDFGGWGEVLCKSRQVMRVTGGEV